MRNRSEKQSSETVPVHFPRPGERYVLAEDLVEDEGVQEQIRSMVKIGGDSRHVDTPQEGSA